MAQTVLDHFLAESCGIKNNNPLYVRIPFFMIMFLRVCVSSKKLFQNNFKKSSYSAGNVKITVVISKPCLFLTTSAPEG
jgi:hypothetical protein